MMRLLLTIAATLAVMGLAFWAYRENYRTQATIDEMEGVQRRIATLREEIGVLRAEWAWQNRPERLAELVDLDHLNASPTRVSVVALDQATGESVVFDNHHGGLRIDHILASASLPLAFPPVRLGGRHLVDAGLSENCPVRRLFDPAPTAPAHCWVIDPWPRQAPLAHSLDEVLGRTQDLAFGCQRDWALRDVAHRLAASDAPQVALHEIIHDEQAWEIGAKAFDYAPAAVERRWSAGRLRMAQALDAADGALGGASTASTRTAPG